MRPLVDVPPDALFAARLLATLAGAWHARGWDPSMLPRDVRYKRDISREGHGVDRWQAPPVTAKIGTGNCTDLVIACALPNDKIAVAHTDGQWHTFRIRGDVVHDDSVKHGMPAPPSQVYANGTHATAIVPDWRPRPGDDAMVVEGNDIAAATAKATKQGAAARETHRNAAINDACTSVIEQIADVLASIGQAVGAVLTVTGIGAGAGAAIGAGSTAIGAAVGDSSAADPECVAALQRRQRMLSQAAQSAGWTGTVPLTDADFVAVARELVEARLVSWAQAHVTDEDEATRRVSIGVLVGAGLPVPGMDVQTRAIFTTSALLARVKLPEPDAVKAAIAQYLQGHLAVKAARGKTAIASPEATTPRPRMALERPEPPAPSPFAAMAVEGVEIPRTTTPTRRRPGCPGGCPI